MVKKGEPFGPRLLGSKSTKIPGRLVSATNEFNGNAVQQPGKKETNCYFRTVAQSGPKSQMDKPQKVEPTLSL